MSLLPLFLVSLAAVGYEIALTRYFATAAWSEYGYWVISIVMVGFALSGVVLALARDRLLAASGWLLPALPALLIATAAIGYRLTTTNPFNPLALQNAATFAPQLGNIALYDAVLLPFFFSAGLFVGLSFITSPARVARVYAFDLAGAGAGALLVLALMTILHPFALVPALLPVLVLAAIASPRRHRRAATLAALVVLAASETALLADDRAHVSEYKSIYAPLNTPDAAIVAARLSPRGVYALLDDFTEHADIDVSNNAGLLGLPGPPASLGLYRDGNRIASLPKPGPLESGYASAALDAAPYALLRAPRVLLIGGGGGFRPAEALALGAAHVTVTEPEPVLSAALRHGLGPSPALSPNPRLTLLDAGPFAATRDGPFDLIDLSSDFLDASEANATAFTAEAIAADLAALAPGGLLSLPVSIRDFPVYALRLLATVRAALPGTDPAAHVAVYRSAWNVRILVSPTPFDPAPAGLGRIAALRAFAADRSFDLSYYPGIDVAAARADLFNDLPAVSFARGEVSSTGQADAIADEALAVLTGQPTPSAEEFDLRPTTLDRPFHYAALRLDRLATVLRRVEILPQAEIAALVNVAVLAQAMVIAALVLALPLLAPSRLRARADLGEQGLSPWRAALYFPALGLGFLFVEIWLIERAAFWLGERAGAFSLVLTGMLVCSGAGSLLAGRLTARPHRGVMLSGVVVLVWAACVAVGLQPLILATLAWPWLARATLLLLVLAPVSVAMGLPFPLGLARAGSGPLLPWAWALNGAFSVVATPLATLVARQFGLATVLFAAIVLYGTAIAAFPSLRMRNQWHPSTLPPATADRSAAAN